MRGIYCTTPPRLRAKMLRMQPGTIVRLNLAAGFGYVRDAPGENCYIFLVGRALTHAAARQMRVGALVEFTVSGNGRVDEIRAAAGKSLEF